MVGFHDADGPEIRTGTGSRERPLLILSRASSAGDGLKERVEGRVKLRVVGEALGAGQLSLRAAAVRQLGPCRQSIAGKFGPWSKR